MTILQISDRDKYGRFLEANHPELYGLDSPVMAYARPNNAVEVHWPESAGPAPTAEEILAWESPPAAPTPRTQALRPEEIAAAREAIAQAEELARQSTQTKYRDALLLLTATFDGVLAKLGGEQ